MSTGKLQKTHFCMLIDWPMVSYNENCQISEPASHTFLPHRGQREPWPQAAARSHLKTGL